MAPSSSSGSSLPPLDMPPNTHPINKRLILCCDGTWMNSDNGYEKASFLKPEGTLQIPSNVTRISRCFKRRCSDGKLQIINYESGVGTGSNTLDSITGGAFGLGLSERMRETYSYLCANYMDGDEIILVGFSRGAFTARSVAGMVSNLGLLTRDGIDHFYPIFKDMQHWNDPDYKDPFPDIPFPDKPKGENAAAEYRSRLEKIGYTRVKQNAGAGELITIKAVCVWDTVGSLGIPRVSWLEKLGIRPDNDEYKWYDTSLSNRIEHAFHALALDEHRPPFSPAVWERLPSERPRLHPLSVFVRLCRSLLLYALSAFSCTPRFPVVTFAPRIYFPLIYIVDDKLHAPSTAAQTSPPFAMAATYKQFLAAPTSSLLADNASLHYITTTTSVSGATEIIKHLNGLQKQVAKEKEEIFNLVDGGNAIVLEVDTGLGFGTSGGPYLPGLDDNFLSSRVAYLSITHFVSFDKAGKIVQIRLQWDQGSLLKQIEIIGKSGRNWPIRDSREQISYIQACLKSAGTLEAPPPSHNENLVRVRGSTTNAFRDPHASLQLFRDREEIESELPAAVVSPYAGSRPQQRSFTEILGDEPVDNGSPSANRHRSMSPSKGGQGKNFQPSRIFDGQQEHEDEEEDSPESKGSRYIRPNPKKFSHFDFADGSDPRDAPEPGQSFDERPKSKHDSQWSFNDFVTPQKVKPSKTLRTQEVRHWDTDKDTIGATPVHLAARPRRDAETHFELQDDGERVPQPPRPNAKPRGYTHNEGLGLYKNQLFDKEDSGSGPDRALGNITNVQTRGKDFDPHFDITDDSPSRPDRYQPIPEGRKKAVKMMNANWSAYDKSPAVKKENRAGNDNRIHIAGDGMGGRKGTDRGWLYGEEEETQHVPTRKANTGPGLGDDPKDTRIHIAGDGMGGKSGTERNYLGAEYDENLPQAVPGRKPGHVDRAEPKQGRIHIGGDGMGGKSGTERNYLGAESDEEQPQAVPGRKPGHVDRAEPKQGRIHIAGDGMGGKKGTDRDWLYGGDSNENEDPFPARKQPAAATAATKKDFWDF